jgi:WSC domain
MNLPGQMKFSRPSFGNGRAYLTTSTGSVVAVGSPTSPPFTCSPPYDFGEVIVGQTSANKTITCKANINIRLDAVQLGSIQNFALSNLPALPYNVKAGQNFTFQATFSPSSPGLLSENVYVNTTNGVPNYATNTPIGLNGDGKSLSSVLAINPNTVSFHGFIIGENPQGATSSVIFSNLGAAVLNITTYQWSTTSDSGPFIQPITNGSNLILGPYIITGSPSTIPGDSQVTVNINFNPQQPGSYPLYVNVFSNGGTGKFTVIGIAGSYPKALLEFEKVDGSGWVAYSNSTPFDFGQVYEGTTKNLNMRLSNVGGLSAGLLDITMSKPPTGAGQVVGARNGIDLGEGTTLGPGESMNATLFCSVPKAQVNTDPYEATTVWTMNTGDPTFGKQIIKFLCHAVAEQVGPLRANGTGQYRYIGCYKENNPGRQLQTQLYGSDLNTNGKCQTDCAAAAQNWIFVGTQYHRECWCGNKIPIQKTDDADCNYDCSGNSSQICGGNGFNNRGSYISLFADADRFSAGNASTPTSTTGTSTATPTSTSLAIVPTIGNYTFQGCYTEATQGRALRDKIVNQPDMNLDYCARNCTGFTYWGVEYGTECYCGNTLGAGSAPATNQDDCTFPCPSNPSQPCGARLRLDLYKLNTTTTEQPPPPSHPNTIRNFTYQGCFTESTTPGRRALSGKSLASNDMTLDYCAANCTGFTYFGAEYARECYCGDALGAGSGLAADQDDCSMGCAGNSSQFCGAGLRLDLYRFGAA